MSINKSKPVYETLRADSSGRYHLLVGFREGAVPLQRVLGELESAAADSLGGTQDSATRTRLLLADTSIDALLAELRALLECSLMGTRLYIAGPEHFIGRVMQIALEFNLNKDEIRAEELGTLARRVHCVHCRATTEEVRTNIACCSGCSRWLMVRDHYSRRFAAYMGVMVDAEAPGELPAVREIYS